MTMQEFNYRISGISDKLSNYSLSLTSNRDDAHDLLQDTYLKALQNKEKFDPSTNINAWAHVIMKNIFINNYRRSKRVNIIADDTDDQFYINKSRTNHNSALEYGYDQNQIMNELKEMEDEDGSAFIMNLEGYKYKEIAEKLNIPIGTVKSRIFLTRKKLINKYKEYSN